MLESADSSDTETGGIRVVFPSGAREDLLWKRAAPIPETRDAAKALVVRLVDKMLKQGLTDDVSRTNIVSLVAGVEKMLIDWNEKRRATLYAEISNGPH